MQTHSVNLSCTCCSFLFHLLDFVYPINNTPAHHCNFQSVFTATEKQKSSILQTKGTHSITKIRFAEKIVRFKDKYYRIQKFSLKLFLLTSFQMELLEKGKKVCDMSLIHLYGWFKRRNLRNISFLLIPKKYSEQR